MKKIKRFVYKIRRKSDGQFMNLWMRTFDTEGTTFGNPQKLAHDLRHFFKETYKCYKKNLRIYAPYVEPQFQDCEIVKYEVEILEKFIKQELLPN